MENDHVELETCVHELAPLAYYCAQPLLDCRVFLTCAPSAHQIIVHLVVHYRAKHLLYHFLVVFLAHALYLVNARTHVRCRYRGVLLLSLFGLAQDRQLSSRGEHALILVDDKVKLLLALLCHIHFSFNVFTRVFILFEIIRYIPLVVIVVLF